MKTVSRTRNALLLCGVAATTNAFTTSSFCNRLPSISSVQDCCHRPSSPRVLQLAITTCLSSNFYSDFDNDESEDDENDDDDDDDDEEDDDYAELDDAAVSSFRSRMGSMFDGGSDTSDTDDNSDIQRDMSTISTVDDLIRFATSAAPDAVDANNWARPWDSSNKLQGGAVLLANPAKFCTGNKNSNPSPALLAKFGLTLPPPADLGPDRRADLLPVLVLLERHALRGCQALLMNRRTGYLLGDLEQQQQQQQGEQALSPPPRLGAFMIQPLWFGGTSASSETGMGGGLDLLHLCPTVKGAKQLTEDGLFWGGDVAQAQEAMLDQELERVYTGFDFKFFVQSTRWLPMQLEKEIRDKTWLVASVSKEVLFKSRDRLGVKRAKPLWTEIMELMGGEYKIIRDELYGDT